MKSHGLTPSARSEKDNGPMTVTEMHIPKTCKIVFQIVFTQKFCLIHLCCSDVTLLSALNLGCIHTWLV